MAQRLIDRTEVELARQMFAEAVADLQRERRSVGTFSSAALLAACELYDVAHDGDLPAALAAILKAREVAAGRAGRA